MGNRRTSVKTWMMIVGVLDEWLLNWTLLLGLMVALYHAQQRIVLYQGKER